MPYVIRSMSTTDFYPGGPPVTPYHVYLLPPGERKGAYWSRLLGLAQQFATVEEAEAECERALPARDEWERKRYRHDIVPVDHDGLPTFWEMQVRHREGR